MTSEIRGQNYPGKRTRTHDRRNVPDPRGPRTYPRQLTRPVASIPSVLSSGSPTGPRSMHPQGGLLGFLRNNLLRGQTSMPARNLPAPRAKGITAKTAGGSRSDPGTVAIDSSRGVPGGNKVLMSVGNDGSGKMIRSDTRPILPQVPPVERVVEEYADWISGGGIQRMARSFMTRAQRAASAFRSG